MATIQRELTRRGFFGWLFLIAFWVFNAFMAFWMFDYWHHVSSIAATGGAERAGKAIGATIGTGLIAFFWVAGAVVLGLFAMLTRGRKVLITEEDPQ